MHNLGCQALIKLKWQNEQFGARCRLVVSVLEVATFVSKSLLLSNQDLNFPEGVKEPWLTTFSSLSAVICVGELFLLLSEMVGHIDQGLTSRFVANGRHWMDMLDTAGTCWVSVQTFLEGLKVAEDPVYSTVF